MLPEHLKVGNTGIDTGLRAVVYFDQCLGAAHSKHWLKYSFSMFFVLKAEKCKKKLK